MGSESSSETRPKSGRRVRACAGNCAGGAAAERRGLGLVSHTLVLLELAAVYY